MITIGQTISLVRRAVTNRPILRFGTFAFLAVLLAALLAPTDLIGVRGEMLRGLVGSSDYGPHYYKYPPVTKLRVTDLFLSPKGMRLRWQGPGDGYTYFVERSERPGVSTTQTSLDDQFTFVPTTTYTYIVTVIDGPVPPAPPGASYDVLPSEPVRIRVVPLSRP